MGVFTDIQIFPLSGSARSIKEYAQAISELSPWVSNAYVMGFDANEEICFCIQAGDDVEDIKAIRFDGVKRVEIYDHGMADYKVEQIYINAQKYLDAYFVKVQECGMSFEVSENRTKFNVSL